MYDLSEVEYENLVKDYETTKISINDLIAKYKLDPSCKKFGFYNAFTRYIKTKLGCPNCGARLYREVFPRKTDRRVVYKGKIDDKKEYVVKVYKKKNKEMFYTISDLFDDLKNLYKAKSLVSNYTKKYQNIPEFVYMNFVNFFIGSEKEKD